MKHILLCLAATSALIFLCSCSLSQSVEWGDCIAEVDIKHIISGMAWSSSELQNTDNAFCMTVRTDEDEPFRFKNIRMTGGQTFMLETVNKNHYDKYREINREDGNGKYFSILRHQDDNEKMLWERHFNAPAIVSDYIYNRNNQLSYIATLLLNDDYDPDYILILDPDSGKILKTFTLDKMVDPKLPWSINISDNLNFLIMAVPIQSMSLQRIYLIFKRVQGKNHFKYTGYLRFPDDEEDGLVPDGIRITNDVAIISMEKGQRTGFVTTQKIVFFDLRSNSTILKYRFVANAIIHDAAITADRNYIAFLIHDSVKSMSFIRLYKLFEKSQIQK